MTATPTPTADPALHGVLGDGPAGRTLATELHRRGHAVRHASRTEPEPVVDGVGTLAADLLLPDEAAAAVAGADVVHHCVNVPYPRQVELVPRLQDAIVEATARAGARLVVLDTLYPYGATGGKPMTEETPWRATSAKGRMRAEVDQRFLDAHAAGRVPVAIGRAADFFGPGVLNSTLGGFVLPGALTGEPVHVLGDPDLRHSYSYLPDVAAGLATLGEEAGGDGRVWHLPTPGARTTTEVLALVAAHVGRPLDVRAVAEPVPTGPLDAALMDELAELYYQYREDQVMVSTAFERAFGVEPTDLDDALAATIAWYRVALGVPA